MKEFELAYQLVRAVMETDEWERIWMEYPGVVEAKARLDAVMEKVPGELANGLWEAFAELDWANECASSSGLFCFKGYGRPGRVFPVCFLSESGGAAWVS